jgi:hypothetical protein
VGAELFRADRRTDMPKLIVASQFWEGAYKFRANKKLVLVLGTFTKICVRADGDLFKRP